MSDILLCDTHRPLPHLITELRSTHMGQFIWRTWPLAVCKTPTWSRLVILPFYNKHRYPAAYYQAGAQITPV